MFLKKIRLSFLSKEGQKKILVWKTGKIRVIFNQVPLINCIIFTATQSYFEKNFGTKKNVYQKEIFVKNFTC